MTSTFMPDGGPDRRGRGEDQRAGGGRAGGDQRDPEHDDDRGRGDDREPICSRRDCRRRVLASLAQQTPARSAQDVAVTMSTSSGGNAIIWGVEHASSGASTGHHRLGHVHRLGQHHRLGRRQPTPSSGASDGQHDRLGCRPTASSGASAATRIVWGVAADTIVWGVERHASSGVSERHASSGASSSNSIVWGGAERSSDELDALNSFIINSLRRNHEEPSLFGTSRADKLRTPMVSQPGFTRFGKIYLWSVIVAGFAVIGGVDP